MKATIEVPDDLYRQVKAKSALEGRAVRDVAEELFRGYVSREPPRASEDQQDAGTSRTRDEDPMPPWFGVLRKYARRVQQHDMDAIRKSIAAGVARERGL